SIRRDRKLATRTSDSPGDPVPPNGGSPACRAVDGPLGSLGLSPGLGRCIGNNVSLLLLVAVAYDLHSNRAGRRISGGPDWTTDLRGHSFQINAVAGNPATVMKADIR